MSILEIFHKLCLILSHPKLKIDLYYTCSIEPNKVQRAKEAISSTRPKNRVAQKSKNSSLDTYAKMDTVDRVIPMKEYSELPPIGKKMHLIEQEGMRETKQNSLESNAPKRLYRFKGLGGYFGYIFWSIFLR